MNDDKDISDPVLMVRDIQDSGLCPPGMAKWFKDNGVDYRRYKNGGYRASDFVIGQDAYVDQVIAQARKRVAQ